MEALSELNLGASFVFSTACVFALFLGLSSSVLVKSMGSPFEAILNDLKYVFLRLKVVDVPES